MNGKPCQENFFASGTVQIQSVGLFLIFFGSLKNLLKKIYVGAIDGKHIAILQPANSGTLYYNYKGYSSIVLLAVCDANYKFLYASFGSYGSSSDGGIFDKCDLKRAIVESKLNLPPVEKLPRSNTALPFFFVGDGAFPLMKNLMKPYPGKNLSIRQETHNYRF